MNTANANANATATALSPAFQTGFTPTVSWAEMVEHRSYLVRFAQRKLRDPLMAEDVVHDVFEAVLSGRAVFAGRAALRSWLTAVLKNKIVDTVRRSVGFESFEDDGEDSGVLAVSARNRAPTRSPSNTSC